MRALSSNHARGANIRHESVRMQYIRQSVTDTKKIVCKSNSLVELRQSQVEDIRTFQTAEGRRGGGIGGVPPRQESEEEEYIVISGGDGACVVQHSYRQQQRFRHAHELSSQSEEAGEDELDYPAFIGMQKSLRSEQVEIEKDSHAAIES